MKKFDFVVGNPPFDENNDKRNRQDAMYDIFMEASYKLSDKVMLITPARFLFNIGSTSTDWNTKILNDPHFKVLKYEKYSYKYFFNTDIKGGVAISYRDKCKLFEPIKTFTQYEELKDILNKVEQIEDSENLGLGDLLNIQNKLNLDYISNNRPEIINKLGSKGREKRLISSIFKKLPEIFHNESEITNKLNEYYRILGREDNQRVYKFVNRNYIEDNENIHKYKVVIPAANGSGYFGEPLSSPLVEDPLTGFTQTFISIGSFDTENEAKNCMKYIKSKFFRTMLGIKKVTQNNKSKETFSKIPLQDFTENSDIDWSKSISEIDQQLYKKYRLSPEEIDFIEEKVQEME